MIKRTAGRHCECKSPPSLTQNGTRTRTVYVEKISPEVRGITFPIPSDVRPEDYPEALFEYKTTRITLETKQPTDHNTIHTGNANRVTLDVFFSRLLNNHL